MVTIRGLAQLPWFEGVISCQQTAHYLMKKKKSMFNKKKQTKTDKVPGRQEQLLKLGKTIVLAGTF